MFFLKNSKFKQELFDILDSSMLFIKLHVSDV